MSASYRTGAQLSSEERYSLLRCLDSLSLDEMACYISYPRRLLYGIVNPIENDPTGSKARAMWTKDQGYSIAIDAPGLGLGPVTIGWITPNAYDRSWSARIATPDGSAIIETLPTRAETAEEAAWMIGHLSFWTDLWLRAAEASAERAYS